MKKLLLGIALLAFSSVSASAGWRSMACALWDEGQTHHASTSISGEVATEDESKSEALRVCIENGGKNCKVVSSFNTGCGYIAMGTKPGQGYWCFWAEDQQTLFDNCTKDGMTCEKVIGDCIQ